MTFFSSGVKSLRMEVPEGNFGQNMIEGYKGGGEVLSLILAGLTLGAVLTVQKLYESAPKSSGPERAAPESAASSTSAGDSSFPRQKGMVVFEVREIGSYRAAIYRYASPPLIFTQGRFILYDQELTPLFETETLEGSREPWTRLYEFTGSRRRARTLLAKDLDADGIPEIIVGQYSGGSYCCTTVTVVSLDPSGTRVVGRIEGIYGMPLESIEARDLDRNGIWELIVHLPLATICGPPGKSPHLPVIYTFREGNLVEASESFRNYFQQLLTRRRSHWQKRPNRSLQFLLNIVLNYALLDQKNEGQNFFSQQIDLVHAELGLNGASREACESDIQILLERTTPISN